MPWEGLLAERDGVDLTPFYLDDYGIPYGYTPLVLARPESIAADDDALEAFLAATARGYRFAADNPAAAADILREEAVGMEADDPQFLRESQRRLADAYCTPDGEWGVMAEDRWAAFVEWLAERDILTDLDGDAIPASALPATDLYTNDLLEASA
jgi:NitT/TauT family transport system substrate-binding protein